MISKSKTKIFDTTFENVDSSWRLLISRLLVLDPDRRPSAIEVLESPLFRSNIPEDVDRILGLVIVRPVERAE
jgi:serine/threonine protein kinase